jgi:hypothetical protein
MPSSLDSLQPRMVVVMCMSLAVTDSPVSLLCYGCLAATVANATQYLDGENSGGIGDGQNVGTIEHCLADRATMIILFSGIAQGRMSFRDISITLLHLQWPVCEPEATRPRQACATNGSLGMVYCRRSQLLRRHRCASLGSGDPARAMPQAHWPSPAEVSYLRLSHLLLSVSSGLSHRWVAR